MKTLTNPQLKQYGPDRGYFITCKQCDTEFLSNAKGHVRCNEYTYKECPFCNENPEFTNAQFKKLCKFYNPVYVADEYKRDKQHWVVFQFKEVKGEFHKLDKVK